MKGSKKMVIGACISFVLATAAAFSAGRYSVNEPTVTPPQKTAQGPMQDWNDRVDVNCQGNLECRKSYARLHQNVAQMEIGLYMLMEDRRRNGSIAAAKSCSELDQACWDELAAISTRAADAVVALREFEEGTTGHLSRGNAGVSVDKELKTNGNGSAL